MTRRETLSTSLFIAISISLLVVYLCTGSPHLLEHGSITNEISRASSHTNSKPIDTKTVATLLTPMKHVLRNAAELESEFIPNTYILPLGDSITQGSGVPGGYRGKLYAKLSALGYNVTFLGTKTKNCVDECTVKQRKYEGHGGKMLSFFLENVEQWMDTYGHDPDVILLLLGTTEFADGAYDVHGAIDRWDALIEKLTVIQPYAHIIASNIIDRAERFNSNINEHFNPFVEGVVQKHAAAGKRVTFVDLHSAIPSNLLADSLHPTELGYDIMADQWLAAMQNVTGPVGDNFPPEIAEIKVSNDLVRVFVKFSKPISDDSVLNPNDFVISNNVSVVSAVLNYDKRQITLTTSGLSWEGAYMMEVTSVTDRTSARLPLAFDIVAFSGPIQPTLSPSVSSSMRMVDSSCKDQNGHFRNSMGFKRKCHTLDTAVRLEQNCGTFEFPRSELGAACPQSCSDYYTCQTNSPVRNPTESPSILPTKYPTELSEPVGYPSNSPVENRISLSCIDKTGPFYVPAIQRYLGCKFVQKNSGKFCNRSHYKINCPATCGQCHIPPQKCVERNEPFYVPGHKMHRNCTFVQKDSKTFCRWNIFKSHCPVTCGQCNPQTDASSDIPSHTCNDNPQSFYVPAVKKNRDCKFIQKDLGKFCKTSIYKNNCPLTCDQCNKSINLSCADSKHKFKLNDSGWKTCEFIAQYKSRYCAWEVPKSKCPETCDLCPTR